jgi:hemin uptake protein HemP
VAKPAATQPRTVESTELLGAQGVLYIRHQNEVYRLQTTRFGKLILTK